MELRLTEPEVKLLREILNADLSGLLMEIARTDNRVMREGLKKRQDLLNEILDRLGGTVAPGSQKGPPPAPKKKTPANKECPPRPPWQGNPRSHFPPSRPQRTLRRKYRAPPFSSGVPPSWRSVRFPCGCFSPHAGRTEEQFLLRSSPPRPA